MCRDGFPGDVLRLLAVGDPGRTLGWREGQQKNKLEGSSLYDSNTLGMEESTEQAKPKLVDDVFPFHDQHHLSRFVDVCFATFEIDFDLEFRRA